MWHPRAVTVWLALRRLLPLLAVLGLALAPVTASAAATGMRATTTFQGHAMAMPDVDMDDMAGMAMDESTSPVAISGATSPRPGRRWPTR